MSFLFLVLCFYATFVSSLVHEKNELKTSAKSTFWLISDIHTDQNYSKTGNPHNLCHDDGKGSFSETGLYGNFLCDSPLLLLNVTVKAMKKIEKNPDFILWTGDNLPHTESFDPDWKKVYQVLNNISALLSHHFVGIPFYPCIGNHDTFPPNMLKPDYSTHSVYAKMLNEGGWKKHLDEQSVSTFKAGGYYSQLIKPRLRIISLNTILWYSPNIYTENMQDPLNQLQWLGDVLKNSSESSENVYIIGHVPPGFYNRVKPGERGLSAYHPHHLEAYLKTVMQYSSVIKGQFFGHLHMDMFQLFQSEFGTFLSSSLLASSVTPWHSESPDNVILPVNPSIRLVHYNSENGLSEDYSQFFFNLSKANSLNGSHDSDKYELLYSFTDAYGVPDLSTPSLVKVYEKLKNNVSVFEKFYIYSTAGKESVSCDEQCKRAQLCSISSLSPSSYDSCMEKEIHPEHVVHYELWLFSAISVVSVSCVVALYIYSKCEERYVCYRRL